MRRDPLLPDEYGRPWLRLVGGAALSLVALVAGGWALDAWADRGSYLRATPCSETVRERCVVDTTAVVVDFVETGGKTLEHYVTFDLGGREDEQDLADPEEVWGLLRRGLVVDVRVWEGDVTRVAVGRRATETNESPVVESLDATGFGTIALGGGIALVVSGRARRRWRRLPIGAMPETLPGVRAGYAVMAAGAAVLLMSAWLDVYDPLPVLAVAAAAAAVPGIWARAVG